MMGATCSNRLALLICALGAFPTAAGANVNLEWRLARTVYRVGDTIEAQLYAVSDDATDQRFIAVDVLLNWDPSVLALSGFLENGFDWNSAGFFPDCGLDRLNDENCITSACESSGATPCNDGDALFTAFIGLSTTPPLATPEGLLIVTFLFEAVGPDLTTEIIVAESVGGISHSRVLDADPAFGTQLVTGTLGTAMFSVSPCGARGDFDGNCRVDINDYADFEWCLAGPDVGAMIVECGAADFNGDKIIDMLDVAEFQREFTGP